MLDVPSKILDVMVAVEQLWSSLAFVVVRCVVVVDVVVGCLVGLLDWRTVFDMLEGVGSDCCRSMLFSCRCWGIVVVDSNTWHDGWVVGLSIYEVVDNWRSSDLLRRS